MLKMSQVETIKELQAKGLGPVAIAERLKITRKTVSKYMASDTYPEKAPNPKVELPSYELYNEKYELYCHTVPTQWSYTEHRLYKGDTVIEPKRMYIHYYYNIDKATGEEKAFDRKLIGLRQELEAGRRVPEHESLYKKYFEVKPRQNGSKRNRQWGGCCQGQTVLRLLCFADEWNDGWMPSLRWSYIGIRT